MFVFRVESKIDGSGPYVGKTSSSSCWVYESKSNMNANHRPGPRECDKIYELYKTDDFYKYNFGFISLSQLKKWFTARDRIILNKHNYICNVYEVDDNFVVKGTNQCCFIKDNAKLVQSIETNTIK